MMQPYRHADIHMLLGAGSEERAHKLVHGISSFWTGCSVNESESFMPV